MKWTFIFLTLSSFSLVQEYGQYFEGDLAISDEQIALYYGDDDDVMVCFK